MTLRSGYTFCPCCGYETVSSDTRKPELCSDCADAGCDPEGIEPCCNPGGSAFDDNGNNELWSRWVGSQTPAEFLANCDNGGTPEEFRDYVLDRIHDGPEDPDDPDVDLVADALHAYAHTTRQTKG